MQQWFYARNTGPDLEFMHYKLGIMPGKAVLMAPGLLVPCPNSRFLWPAGAIVCVPRDVWTLTPALGGKPWVEEVSQEEFAAALRDWLTPPVVAEVPEPEVLILEAEDPADPEVPEAPKRPRGRPRKAA